MIIPNPLKFVVNYVIVVVIVAGGVGVADDTGIAVVDIFILTVD